MRSETENERITAQRIDAVAKRGREIQDQHKREADAAAFAYNQRAAAASKHPPGYYGSPAWHQEVVERHAREKAAALVALKKEEEERSHRLNPPREPATRPRSRT